MDKPMTFIEWCASKGVIPYSLGIEAAYEAGQQSQQSKVEELQRRNQMLNDNIKEQGQKLVYQNEVIETQAEKLLGLRDEKAELQKRVDAAIKCADLNFWNANTVKAMVEALKGEG
ncbi:hypothetical protein [Acinetobacter baumannii]|uniref:hypothetical protein n=1 Tax=Acinetobacter baumannii TaxID=470 RepID=UPI00045050AD|nr:hypothetical protein [Acinetobacter baumannii]EXA76056.1 hypothetical protein J523_3544 [Acinetobacter baumannii 1202252]EXC96572.1 hypothetical protein J495_3630 [Acinetobacter baumannii 1075025]EXD19072.1 hypothetical protein J494_3541 [Acinetobacter baumannii 29280]EXD21091.1 hypothetical protein J494_2997 [Acinetobacter baumannii 29280]EXD38819.1 hypothetical protein J487_3861 [Acinetobacter baumannii 562700]